MPSEHLNRRLAVIFYADVAGYSRLTGEDEEGTHRTVSTYLKLISENIRRFGGRIGHFAGDAVLADFESALDALVCAGHIQTELAKRNGMLSPDKKVEFRIGINLGDVIEDRGEVHGDGAQPAEGDAPADKAEGGEQPAEGNGGDFGGGEVAEGRGHLECSH